MEGKPAIQVLFDAYGTTLRQADFLAMGGQIVDATMVAAPKQRNSEAEKGDLRAGRGLMPGRLSRPNFPKRTAPRADDQVVEGQAERGRGEARGHCRAGLRLQEQRRHRPPLIRTWMAADAARHDGAQLPGLLSKANTAGDVWADTAYRSKQNEAHLAGNGFRPRIHRKKPPGKPLARNVARANGRKVRAAVEHVFARQKGPMGLVVRTIGLARAAVKIGSTDLVCNMNRSVWLNGSRMKTV